MLMRIHAGNPRQGVIGRRWQDWRAAKVGIPTTPGELYGSRRRRLRARPGAAVTRFYTNHRDILDEIEAAAHADVPVRDLAARLVELESELVRLKAESRLHGEERRELASENLTLLYRARSAEQKLETYLRRTGSVPAQAAAQTG
jgi:hypothetical protein